MNKYNLREATPRDADKIGTLHALSWLNTYKGLLPDSYLDNNLAEERRKYWIGKLPGLSPKEFVLVAEDERGLLGFASLLDKPENGYEALIDNLHVRPDLKGNGIGAKLMKAVAEKLIATGRKSVYLWVLNGNTAAEEFYKRKGGKPSDHGSAEFGGTLVSERRFVWDDLTNLTSVI